METLYTIKNTRGNTLFTIASDLFHSKMIYGYCIGNSKVMTICTLDRLAKIIDKAEEKGYIIESNF